MTYPPTDDPDGDFDDAPERTPDGRPIHRHVVRDLSAAVKMKRLQARADERARKAEARATMATVRAEERAASSIRKAELAKMRLKMTAREAASKHLAVFGPLYLMLLVAMFLAALGTGMIDVEQTPVVSALLTLLITMIGANLRSIVSEGNGQDEPDDEPDAKDSTSKKNSDYR